MAKRSTIEKQRDDAAALFRRSRAASRSLSRDVRTNAMQIYKSRGVEALEKYVTGALNGFQEVLENGMVTAHLYGRIRTAKNVQGHIESTPSFANTPFDTAKEWAKARQKVTEEDLTVLREKYGDVVTDVTRTGSLFVEKKIKVATARIISKQMHVQEAMATLRNAFSDAGMDTVNPWLLETLARTQIQVAYSAGRWNANKEAAVDEILWGYEYVTVGDIRVRPNHKLLNGMRLPKNDRRWATHWPPNGFNCRCDTLEVFKGDQRTKDIKDVPQPQMVEGEMVAPGPDADWDVNHGEAFSDMLNTVSAV